MITNVQGVRDTVPDFAPIEMEALLVDPCDPDPAEAERLVDVLS